jgi:hypothetical protein
LFPSGVIRLRGEGKVPLPDRGSAAFWIAARPSKGQARKNKPLKEAEKESALAGLGFVVEGFEPRRGNPNASIDMYGRGGNFALFNWSRNLWEDFEAGRIAICEKMPGENFFLTTVYHEWFILPSLD